MRISFVNNFFCTAQIDVHVNLLSAIFTVRPNTFVQHSTKCCVASSLACGKLPNYSVKKTVAFIKQQLYRFLTIGLSKTGNVLIVAFTERNDIIKIITARKATKIERKYYENE